MLWRFTALLRFGRMPTTVFASLPDGCYVKVLDENVRGMNFVKIKGRYALVLDLLGSACGRAGGGTLAA